MRMIRFRVQNYKNIEDTDWVNCEALTCFVGKNESGKSSVLRGLSKLNPSDDEKYNGLKEFPRKRYSTDFKQSDWAVSSVDFELSNEEMAEIATICPLLSSVKRVICTRRYSWKLEVDFGFSIPVVSWKKYVSSLKGWVENLQQLTAPEERSNDFAALKNNLINGLSTRLQQVSNQSQNDDKVDIGRVTETFSYVFGQLTVDWQKEVLKPLLEPLKQLKNDVDVSENVVKAQELVQKKIPKFVYFAEFNVIESAINITDFNNRINNNPSDPRLRATKCLFEHVGLSIDGLQNLDPVRAKDRTKEDLRKMADEREILLSAASSVMTDKFSGWWEQRKHKFRYQADGPSFRVWVSDNLDPSEIELDQRSQGMQYFFSFYLVFLVEAKGMYNNSIILLDEPALHLHGTAQQQIVKFLGKLSKENQLLYSTHSPFMVDGDNLGNVRVVSEKKDGTVLVSDNVWPKDEDALFPLQAGLGYSIAQTLFYSKRQVIVEGLTDYWIMKAVNGLLTQKRMTALRDDIAIVPCGGTKRLFPLASMLMGNKIELAILLDGDEVGKQWGREAKEQLLTKGIFVNQYTKTEQAEIEDLLPPKMYLQAVEEAYPDIKNLLSFTKDEERIECISKRVKAVFKRLGKEYEKWEPTRILVDKIREKPDEFPNESLQLFSKLSEDINKLLPEKK
ncbi:MAG: AAA family ATPase [Candidatus Bathyarchaeia archaeon]